MKKLFIVLLLCFLITGCFTKTIEEPTYDTYSDTKKFKEEYEMGNNGIEVLVDENSDIHYLSVEEALDLLSNKTGVIYFGRSSCPWCRNAIPVLLKVLNDNKLTLNYLNPSELKEIDIDNYVLLKNKISDYLYEDEKGDKILYIPDVYFVKNGVIIGHLVGTVKSQIDPYIPLTEEQKNELYNIYNDYIKEIKE